MTPASWARSLGLGVLGVLLETATRAFACSPTPVTFEELVHRADAIFNGIVVDASARRPTEGAPGFHEVDVTFDVLTWWRGYERRTATVRTGTDTCGLALGLTKGTRWVILARGDPLRTNAVSGSQRIDETQALDKVIRLLGVGREPE